ncbi:hypothetical protein EZV62_004488 [Acer yangbiense]|uniref:PUM-HD domain-containing protein n=1 Tax=Acer yangbiense TaxID=1000413 RepID=A0A5C7IJU6_9ROSI|nr:hypothetical protein EZV62_004488 [Acer yangbiense]
MATESAMRIVEVSVAGNRPSSKDSAIFGSRLKNMAAEELGLLLNGNRFHGDQTDMIPNRSGSGSANALGNHESEEQLRSDPAYNWRSTSLDDSDNGSLNLSQNSLSTHKEEPEDDRPPRQEPDDWAENSIELSVGQNSALLVGRHKSLVDLIQVQGVLAQAVSLGMIHTNSGMEKLTHGQIKLSSFEHVLERGQPHERSQIISKLAGKIVQMSQHKYASNVVEKCLEYCNNAERELLIEEIIGQTEENDNLLYGLVNLYLFIALRCGRKIERTPNGTFEFLLTKTLDIPMRASSMMNDQFANYVVQKIPERCSDSDKQ